MSAFQQPYQQPMQNGHQPTYSSSSQAHEHKASLPSASLYSPSQQQQQRLRIDYGLDDEEELEEEEQRYRNQVRGPTPEGYYEDIYGQYAQMDDPVMLHDSATPYTASSQAMGRKDTVRTHATTKSSMFGGAAAGNLKRNQSTSNQTEKTSSSSSKLGSLFGSRRAKNQSISDAATTGARSRHTRGVGSSTLPLSSPAAKRFGWFPSTWAARLFFLFTLAEAVADISIEAVLLSRFHEQQGKLTGNSGNLSALPVFLMVFGMAHVYQCFLAVDSIVNRNTILVFGLVIFNLAFLVYAMIQIIEIRTVLGDGVAEGTSQIVPVQVLTGAIPVIIGVTSLVLAILAYYLWKEFGWQIYKTIGADRRLKRAHLHFQIFVCLLKFDFFTFIAYCLQLVLVVLQRSTAEFWITTFAAPVALFLLFFAWYSVRTELKWGAVTFMIGLWGGAGYFAYKLFRIWQQRTGAYSEVYKSLTVFSVLALALLFATFVMTIRCMMNFDLGLKAAMTRSEKERRALKEDEMGPVISAPFQYDLDSPYRKAQGLPPHHNHNGAAPKTADGAGSYATSPMYGGYAESTAQGLGSYFDPLPYSSTTNLPPSASSQGLLSPTKSPSGLMPVKGSSSNLYLDRTNPHRLSLD